jgi:hypothetical protein
MQRRTKIIGAGIAAIVIAGGAGAGVALSGGNDNDTPISGSSLERASTAALDHTGEGRVTDTEVGDEEGAYEVEVTLDDGSQVDVHLDEDFEVIGTEADSDETEDEGEEDEDGDDQ